MVTKKVRCLYGYYEEVKTVTYDRVLKYMPYAQAGVVFKNDRKETILVSYESCILSVSNNGSIDFYRTAPNCSMTTIKHVIAFLREYLPAITYQQVKKAYIKDDMTPWIIRDNNLVNPLTGEVV